MRSLRKIRVNLYSSRTPLEEQRLYLNLVILRYIPGFRNGITWLYERMTRVRQFQE